MQKTCIIIPCYNEEKRLPVEVIEQYYENSKTSFLFVNDGSKDKTLEVLNKLKNNRSDRINVYNMPQNGGKAEAVRQGVLFAIEWKKFDYVGYFDADLATPLWEISYLESRFEKSEKIAVVFGSRVKLMGRNIQRKLKRHYMGRVFSTIASLILKLPVYDTQCGAKMFKSELATELFQEKFITKWLFDVELFGRIVKKYGKEKAMEMIYETPLHQWADIAGSKISMKHFIRVPLELWKIYRKIYG